MDVKAKGNILGNIIPARYILVVLGSIGLAIVYGLKVNLSVAMVGMVNHTALKKTNLGNNSLQNTTNNGITNSPEQDGPFTWSSKTQGVILSCYFWGYFVSQIPGGRVAELFSAKWVMFLSVAINVVCTLLTPVMAELHYSALVCMRVLEGTGGGVTLPGMNVLISKWSPPAERIVMSALVYTGTSLGTVISMLITGILTDKAGWESSFYIMGGLSVIWCVLWAVLIQDSPEKQPLISFEERNMIITSLRGNSARREQKKMSVPWCAVFTSPPFIALLVVHTCSTWGWYLLLLDLPLYMKQVLHFNITQNTLSTALPFLTLWIFSILLGKTIDWFRSKNIITTTTARKIGTSIASVCPSICLFVLCFIGNHPAAAVAIMTIGITSTGGMFCGFLTNHIDIAPNFAGTLMALTNTVASIPGIVVPIFVGAITHDNQTIHEWRTIFYLTIGMYIIGITTYLAFGSSEEQPWNKVAVDNEVEVKPLNEEKKTEA